MPTQQRQEAVGSLVRRLQKVSLDHFAGDVQTAWQDFNQQETPRPFQQSDPELQIFIPYFLLTQPQPSRSDD